MQNTSMKVRAFTVSVCEHSVDQCQRNVIAPLARASLLCCVRVPKDTSRSLSKATHAQLVYLLISLGLVLTVMPGLQVHS